MKTGLVSSLLAFFCLSAAFAANVYECQIGEQMFDQEDFPNIDDLGYESYQMTVEYTVPGLSQTDFYNEYYDSLNHRGDVEAHQSGEMLTYVYNAETGEAWNIKGRECNLNNFTDTPDIFRDLQTYWTYEKEGDPFSRTVGPSAMFKNAWAIWNQTDLRRSMAFLGKMPHTHIRGLEARVWRWCESENVSVDFYFTTEDTDNEYKLKTLPLRVTFNGVREGELESLSDQSYDIMNFQPFISPGLHPFMLPKGLGCGRLDGIDVPEMPTPEPGSPVLFWAEVIYKKVNKNTQEDLSTFYSKIMIAADPLYNNIAYRNSPWNSTKVKGDDGVERFKSFQDAPEYVIYDATLGYGYRVNYGTGECVIGRGKDFNPIFRLPEDGGDLDLSNPFIFFPNSEFTYLSKGYDRGLKVEIFEAVSPGYLLNVLEQAYKVIVSHSYLEGDVRVDNEVNIKNAPTQTEMHIFRDRNSDLEEVLTINFYGYTTKFTSSRKRLFDVSRCFKNDDEYSWVTIGFEIPKDKDNFEVDLTLVEQQMLSKLYESAGDAMNPTRVPTVLVDVSDYLSITFLVLEKPTVQLDFPESEPGKTMEGVEAIGLKTFDTCAIDCLGATNCWGFSICGNTCFMGDSANVNNTVTDKEDCTLYRRYNNDTYMKPKSEVINYWRDQVNEGVFKLTVFNTKADQEMGLTAVYIQEMDPAEDDQAFDKMGNILSERMRVLKVGQKLKNGKSLGKLRFDECQRLCLDYQDCETLSYCLQDANCAISPKYGEEIGAGDVQDDPLCELVTRTYRDHFDVNPGYFMKVDAKKSINATDAEACARACLKETGFQCLSVDMCSDDDSGKNCFLHTSHFLTKSTRKDELGTKASCTHHSRKYSIEFKKNTQTRVKGTKVPALTNLALEECAKRCVDYGQGGCYGFDFCQGTATDTSSSSCILIDSDPSRLENIYSSVCTQFLRSEAAYAPRPFTNGYAGGIGFLCFLIGGLVGAVVVFTIAYFRVNRQR